MGKKAQQIQFAPTHITEIELVAIETARLQLAQINRKKAVAEASLESQEQEVMTRLRGGAKILGNLTASIVTQTGPCRPKWNEIHIKHMETAHGILAKTVEARAQARYPAKKHKVLIIKPKPLT